MQVAISQAFSTIHEWDAALFARMSTVLQQVDAGSYGLGSIAAIAQAYSHQEVRAFVDTSQFLKMLIGWNRRGHLTHGVMTVRAGSGQGFA